MLVIGLTGGIGSGKTAVSDAFAELDVPVIDADVIAREQVTAGQPALAAIVDRFGAGVLLADGGLDRRKLRERVFADDSARADLERLLHPAIDAEIRRRLAAAERAGSVYAVVVIPLLAETGRRDYIDRVLVVDVDQAAQIERVVARDRVDEAAARSVLAAQASRDDRLALADDVIRNDADFAELHRRVAELHQNYRRSAASGAAR